MTPRHDIDDGTRYGTSSGDLASRVGLGGLDIASLAVETSTSGLIAHFRSKEQLQLQTLEHTRHRFIDIVVRPALAAPAGPLRLRASFDHWLTWDDTALSGGCLFVAVAAELDDQPGGPSDRLLRPERDWNAFLRTAVQLTADEADTSVDAAQTASDTHALMLGHNQTAPPPRRPRNRHSTKPARIRAIVPCPFHLRGHE